MYSPSTNSNVIPDQVAKQIAKDEIADSSMLLKKGIWLYFILLIIEGALRRWFLPSLSNPLLIVRDPVALWLLAVAWKRGFVPSNIYLTGMVLIGILGIFTAIFLGHGNLTVAIYGARILLLHFPIIFVIGRVFNREDVIRMGKAILWISIPMTVLIVLQLYSPQSAWVNRGLGGDLAGAGFDGAGGFFRPPGTFSFTMGVHLFYGIAACFIFYFWFNPKMISKLLLITVTICLVVAIPTSISRSLFYHVAITFSFAIIISLHKPNVFGKMLFACVGAVLVLIVLSELSFFETALGAFTNRFTGATEYEGGVKGTLGDRYLGSMVGAITGSSELPFFGYGLGMGTNVGGLLLTGTAGFTIAEFEWPRVIGELGLLMGLTVLFIRVAFCLKAAIASYSMLKHGDVLPWLLVSYGLFTIPQGQWAQPMSLGFGILIGGLMQASFRKAPSKI